jgi:phosphomannomutase
MLTPQIFKANDIRGVAVGPQPEWDADGAYAIGAALADTLDLAVTSTALVVGRDMRLTGPVLSRAFVDGVRDRGVDVIDIGLSSTDQLWFASGHLGLPGAMFTASHNPGNYNGVKFCLAYAAPIEPEQLAEIKRRAMSPSSSSLSPSSLSTSSGRSATRGTLTSRDLLGDYAAHLHSLVDLAGIRRLRVVVDAGNGMAGHTLPAVLGGQDLELIELYTDLDGNFPNHPPNPLEPENLLDAQAAVREHAADLALVFDGDADRCFVIDERGEVVNPSTITALIASQELEREPGATIVINAITSQAVPEIVEARGGRIVITKVGHTFVKAAMADHSAIFGGEHSAHYYFREFWGADTGMLAALHVLAALGQSEEPLSTLAEQFSRFAASGEINSTVNDAEGVTERLAEHFADRGRLERLDGLTVRGEDWWINVRPSNTEPLLRLNVEASSETEVEALRDEALAIIRG